MSDICTCGRRRSTAADLQRWVDEVGINTRAPDPEWAKALCWIKGGFVCPMRPLQGEQVITEQQIDIALGLLADCDPTGDPDMTSVYVSAMSPITGYAAVLRELREERKFTSQLRDKLREKSKLIDEIDRALAALRHEVGAITQDRDHYRCIVQADRSMADHLRDRVDELEARATTTVTVGHVEPIDPEQVDKLQALLIRTCPTCGAKLGTDHELNSDPSAMDEQDADSGNVCVTCGAFQRFEPAIVDPMIERDRFAAKLRMISQIVEANEGDARGQLEAIEAVITADDDDVITAERNQLAAIEQVLDDANVEDLDGDDGTLIGLVKALVEQRNGLAGQVNKFSTELRWLQDMTKERDAVIMTEYQAHKDRYTKPDGSNMSEAEILKAIIAQRDAALVVSEGVSLVIHEARVWNNNQGSEMARLDLSRAVNELYTRQKTGEPARVQLDLSSERATAWAYFRHGWFGSASFDYVGAEKDAKETAFDVLWNEHTVYLSADGVGDNG